MSAAQIEIEPELDNSLASLKADGCRVEITRNPPNCWRVSVTEADGTVHEVILFSDSEVFATIRAE